MSNAQSLSQAAKGCLATRLSKIPLTFFRLGSDYGGGITCPIFFWSTPVCALARRHAAAV